jgi:glutamate synthase (NADPH/NADH) large chain
MTGGEVVVLGSTGRNFAAGMSGGVAYAVDLDPGRVNHELVDLKALDDLAAERVRHLITRHAEETESPVAQALLLEWESVRRRITEVMPRDYRRILEARSKAERDGLDDAQTTAAMMEAAHG